jgi:hypothetical protein
MPFYYVEERVKIEIVVYMSIFTLFFCIKIVRKGRSK